MKLDAWGRAVRHRDWDGHQRWQVSCRACRNLRTGRAIGLGKTETLELAQARWGEHKATARHGRNI
jgi:hypothetical protein